MKNGLLVLVRLLGSAVCTLAQPQGVIGVAFLQAIIVGVALLVAGVPWAGVLAVIVLVLGIAQVPALSVILPAIIYLWSSGAYSTAVAVAYTVVFFLAGMADNVLKPLMLDGGRCADAGQSARRTGRHGDRWHPGDVRRCYPTDAGLSDLHGLGSGQPTRRAGAGGKRRAVGALNGRPLLWGITLITALILLLQPSSAVLVAGPLPSAAGLCA